MPDHSQFNIDRTYPGRWTITFSNPPTADRFQLQVHRDNRFMGLWRNDPPSDPGVHHSWRAKERRWR